MSRPSVAFFPEAAQGPALNSVGIAQAVQNLGNRAVSFSDPGSLAVDRAYGLEAHPVCLWAPMPPEQMARFWEDFINRPMRHFRQSPDDPIDRYGKEGWSRIVDSVKWAQKDLPAVLERVRPDLVCVDNVNLFPAVKPHGKPWVPITCCSPNGIEEPHLPPHLGGCRASDSDRRARLRARFREAIGLIHEEFCHFLAGRCTYAHESAQIIEIEPDTAAFVPQDGMGGCKVHAMLTKVYMIR
jgi:UDP:flavonoid glycosyltransferase YjiC (YdhE family)